MKKLFNILVLVAISISFILASSGFAHAKYPAVKIDSGMKLVDAFEGGRLYMAGGMKIVQLNGGFRQMGRQYGRLLKNEINAVYDITVNRVLMGEKKIKFEEILAGAREAEMTPPQYIKEMVAGMAETSGLSYDQADIVRVNLICLGLMCSAAAAYEDNTKDGNVVFGRNLDLGKGPISLLKPFTVVVVYNPLWTGMNSVAEITYAGGIYAQTLFNKSGIILEMNNGLMSCLPDKEKKIESDPLAYKMYDIMFSCFDLASVLDDIRKIRMDCGMMLNVADSKRAYCCELSPSGAYAREGDLPGFLAVSNHFLQPGWKGPIEIKKGVGYGLTLERHKNLVKQGRRNRGKFDAERMMAVFDRTIPKGGPTFPTGKKATLQTLYSCVFTPADLKLFVKNRGLSNWIEVPLADLFLPKNRQSR